MKNIIFFTITCIIISSCKKDMGHYDEFIIMNNSTHKVSYTIYNMNSRVSSYQDSTLTLKPEQSKIFCEDSRFKGGGELKEDYTIPPPPFFADSIRVCYDDTICITHKMITGIPPENNIFIGQSWISNSIGKNQIRHTYSFTIADYQEALDNQ
ncbi:MAG: hypothetical protein ACPGVD_12010 [Flavobacteriales bacterium]